MLPPGASVAGMEPTLKYPVSPLVAEKELRFKVFEAPELAMLSICVSDVPGTSGPKERLEADTRLGSSAGPLMTVTMTSSRYHV